MFKTTQAEESLQRHLFELNLTLEELAEFAKAGEFPDHRTRIIYALAQDLGLAS